MLTLFLVFGLIPFAVTWVVPRRFFGFYVACLAMLFAVLSVIPSGRDHSSPFAGTGNAFFLLFVLIFAIAIATKGLYFAIRRARRPDADVASNPDGSAVIRASDPSGVSWLITGLIAGFCAVMTFSLGSSDMRPPLRAHIPALMAEGLALVFAIVGLALPRVRPSMRLLALGLFFSVTVACGAGTVWVWSNINAVVDRAEATAEGRPYCIQVVGGRGGYSAATARIDFSPLTMRARCTDGWCWENHAILATDMGNERVLMNWSHRRKEFRSEVLNAKTHPPQIVCHPRAHFAIDLPWF